MDNPVSPPAPSSSSEEGDSRMPTGSTISTNLSRLGIACTLAAVLYFKPLSSNMLWLLTGSFVVVAFAIHYWRSNTREFYNLPGPRFRWYTPLVGDLPDLTSSLDMLIAPSWISQGWTGRYRFLFGTERMYTMDPGAVGHILNNPDVWVKPQDVKAIMLRVTGEGLVSVEGAQHKRQRRVVSPAFSTSSLASMGPVLWTKAQELVTLFHHLIADDSLEALAARPADPEDKVPGARKIDILQHMTSFSADVIGLCGFGHDFESLSPSGPRDKMAQDFLELVDAVAMHPILNEVQNLWPILDGLPTPARRIIARCKRDVDKISEGFVARKRAEIHGNGLGLGLHTNGGGEKGENDILSRLLAANAKGGSQGALSDNELRDQIVTMLFAGSITTAASITDLIYRLAFNPRVQEKLRAELMELGDAHDMSVLDNAPYLDAVVRESLRLDSPVTCTVRETAKDTVLPFEVPVKGRDGKMMTEVPVKKGTYILLSFSGMHTAPELWGDDAGEFRPERHQEDYWPRKPIPGLVKNTASFAVGPHGCLGYRLALNEIKVATFMLLREFEFAPLPSNPEITQRMVFSLQPEVKGQPGAQMPLMVRPLKEA